MKNVFCNKNFVLIFLGALVSNIVNLFYSFAVGYWILEITNNNAIIQGTYLGVCGITFIMFSLFGGVLSDKFNNAKIMYICDFIKGILIIFSSIAILISEKDVTVSLVMLFFMGIVSNLIAAVFSPASVSIMPKILQKEQLQQANSYISVLNYLQGIIGMFLASVLYASLPITTIFFIVGICYIISAISEMFIKYEYKPSESKLTLKRTFLDIKDGFRYVKTNKSLTTLLAMVVLINFFLAPITSNFITYFVKTDISSNPNYLFKELVSPEMWGSIFSIFLSIASIIFGIVLSTKTLDKNVGKKIKKWLFIFGLITLCIAVSYTIFVDQNSLLNIFLIILSVCSFGMGMALSFVNIPISTAIQTITDEENLGKVSSITSMVSQGLIPIATFVAGFIISYFGSSILLLVCSIGLLLTTIVSLFNKSINNL